MNFINKLVYGRNDYSPKCKDILQKYGNVPISSINIRRTPLNTILNRTFKTLSYALLKEPYDKLFHLSIIFYLSNGQSVLVEKNEVINMDVNPNTPTHSQFMSVNVNKPLTINTCLNNAKLYLKGKFFPYSAYDNNCQHFIEAILLSNQLNTVENIAFVKQNTEYLFQNIPYLRKIVNTVTDIAGRANVIEQGGSIQNNGLSSDTIDKILKPRCPNYNGWYSKDTLPNQLKYGWYMVNMQDHNKGNGTHWVCLKYNPFTSIYFDSFGVILPYDILERCNHNMVYNEEQIQDINSTACGWFCIALILSDKDKNLNEGVFLNRYIHNFSKDTLINDRILKDLLKKEGL